MCGEHGEHGGMWLPTFEREDVGSCASPEARQVRKQSMCCVTDETKGNDNVQMFHVLAKSLLPSSSIRHDVGPRSTWSRLQLCLHLSDVSYLKTRHLKEVSQFTYSGQGTYRHVAYMRVHIYSFDHLMRA